MIRESCALRNTFIVLCQWSDLQHPTIIDRKFTFPVSNPPAKEENVVVPRWYFLYRGLSIAQSKHIPLIDEDKSITTYRYSFSARSRWNILIMHIRTLHWRTLKFTHWCLHCSAMGAIRLSLFAISMSNYEKHGSVQSMPDIR